MAFTFPSMTMGPATVLQLSRERAARPNTRSTRRPGIFFCYRLVTRTSHQTASSNLFSLPPRSTSLLGPIIRLV